jgi:hypothetical protein
MKSKLFILFIIGMFFCRISLFAQTSEKSIEGNWYAEELSKSTIMIYKDSTGALSGKIIKSSDDGLINKILLTEFKFQADKKNFVGKVKPPKRNFTLDGEITKIGENSLRLVGSRFFISKTFILEKIQ